MRRSSPGGEVSTGAGERAPSQGQSDDLVLRIDEVVRLELGTFVRPSEETGTARPRVETALG